MWIITKSFNAYDQHWQYAVAVFLNKPTVQDIINLQLKDMVDWDYYPEDHIDDIDYLLSGGWRRFNRHAWYNLIEIEEWQILFDED